MLPECQSVDVARLRLGYRMSTIEYCLVKVQEMHGLLHAYIIHIMLLHQHHIIAYYIGNIVVLYCTVLYCTVLYCTVCLACAGVEP